MQVGAGETSSSAVVEQDASRQREIHQEVSEFLFQLQPEPILTVQNIVAVNGRWCAPLTTILFFSRLFLIFRLSFNEETCSSVGLFYAVAGQCACVNMSQYGEHYAQMFLCYTKGLLERGRGTVSAATVLPCDIIDKESSSCSSVVAACNRSVERAQISLR